VFLCDDIYLYNEHESKHRGFQTFPPVHDRHFPFLLCRGLESKSCFLLLLGNHARCSNDISLCPADGEEVYSEVYFI
jgi:hypothetical protein